ncbi:MAG TPA: PKD domain-containing protein [Baekduia sp.]|uniref:PKD domain-containing protein n=1 Tax=Baekduia sp. TaxID=2600305 RepID=UPI002B85874C|nr:PKD domain-containing protein [Baekduia sp.]HMJ33351.1 PKD domain-containing protein [Baekduia sp.]
MRGASVTGASLAANASGAQAASWLEGGYVRVATRAPGGAWEPVAVPLSGPGIGSGPVLTMAPDGTVAVGWLEGGTVEVSVRGVSGAFSAPVTITSGMNPGSLAIASGPASDILLAWTDTSVTLGRVMTAYRPAGGPSFKTPVSALSAAPNVNQSLYLQATQVAFDPAGEIALIWLRAIVDSGANTTVTHWEGKSRTAGPAGAFQGMFPHDFETRTVNSTLPSALITGVLTADASGRTSFLWPPLAAGGGLDMATRTSGSGFGATQTVLPSATARIDAAAAGSNLMVVDGKLPSVAVAPPGGALGVFDATPFATVGTSTGAIVAGDASGDAATLWGSKDGTNYSLHATIYDATPPEARDVAVPATATAGDAATFSATPWDALTAATATWDFGDGTTATGASVQHAYATAGDRTVTVTVTDQGANTTTATRSISVRTPSPPGSSPPPPPAPVAATVAGLRLSPATFRAARSGASATAAAARTGTRVSYTLNVAANTRFTIQRATSGRTVSGRCVKPTRSNGTRKPCTRFVAVRGSFTRTRAAGADRFTFTGRLTGHALTPGRYRLIATPAANGHTGTSSRVSFRIVK